MPARDSDVELSEAPNDLGRKGNVFPLRLRDHLLGVLVIGQSPGEHYAAKERELIAHVAQAVGASLFALKARATDEGLQIAEQQLRMRARKLKPARRIWITRTQTPRSSSIGLTHRDELVRLETRRRAMPSVHSVLARNSRRIAGLPARRGSLVCIQASCPIRRHPRLKWRCYCALSSCQRRSKTGPHLILPAAVFGGCQTASRIFSENNAIVLRSEHELWSKGYLGVAEGSEVAIRFTSTGIQLGEFQSIAPIGSKVRIQGMAVFRLSHGKIIEQWGMPDIHGLLAQLREKKPDPM